MWSFFFFANREIVSGLWLGCIIKFWHITSSLSVYSIWCFQLLLIIQRYALFFLKWEIFSYLFAIHLSHFYCGHTVYFVLLNVWVSLLILAQCTVNLGSCRCSCLMAINSSLWSVLSFVRSILLNIIFMVIWFFCLNLFLLFDIEKVVSRLLINIDI